MLVDLVRQLYKLVGANLGERKPSAENWRWKPQIRIQDRNESPEVVLERAVALLAKQRHLENGATRFPWHQDWSTTNLTSVLPLILPGSREIASISTS